MQQAAADQEIEAGNIEDLSMGFLRRKISSLTRAIRRRGALLSFARKFDRMATVAKRLEDAGVVPVAKTRLEPCLGDRWLGGTTRNPWDVRQGSSEFR